MSLEEAKRAKLDLVCRKLGLRPGDAAAGCRLRLGLLAVHAAREYGVQATGVTLSREQEASYARKRADGLPVERYIAPDMHMRPVGETAAFLERGAGGT